jgi:hypothetical protein
VGAKNSDETGMEKKREKKAGKTRDETKKKVTEISLETRKRLTLA